MTCEEVQNLLHPYFDDELDVVTHVQVEKHLGGCDQCSARVKELQSLRGSLSAPSLYFRAPSSLRTRLGSAPEPLRSAAGHERTRRYPGLAAIAAGILLLVGVSAITAVLWSNARRSDDQFTELVVAAHVRSLLANHATDVASTDQHTVKPWFDGKLDFAPQVPDLSAQGYTLSGGRLDYLLDRPVAALVYFRHKHPINVFTWPAEDGAEESVQQTSRQGFHIRHWKHDRMEYWAISDMSDHDLDSFVQLFQQQSPVTSR
jgi:anti-sigma factor RsiW